MRRIYFLLIYILVGTTYVFACSCYDVSVGKALRKSELAFVGKVKQVTKHDYNDSIKGYDGKIHHLEYSLYDFEFEIMEIFKGKIKTKVVTIMTTGTEDDCSGYYEKDKEYLIYAYTSNRNPYLETKMGPYLTTDICIGSKLVSSLEPKRLKRLKRRKKREK